jgi:hypothetical protein
MPLSTADQDYGVSFLFLQQQMGTLHQDRRRIKDPCFVSTVFQQPLCLDLLSYFRQVPHG